MSTRVDSPTPPPVAAASDPAAPTDPAYPLAGVRVVDFCWVYAGPLVTRLLAELGAEVIKIESRKRLDGTRLGRPIVGNAIAAGDKGLEPELQPLNHALNRNKRSLTVDVSTPRGVELIKALVRRSDIVTDNFNAGVMDRLGLGYPDLRALKADIIVLSMSGAGQYGPLKDVLVYANTLAPLSGVGRLVGYPGEPPLGVMKPTYGDTNAAVRSVSALLVALYHRNRTGKGQFIDVSEWEASLMGLEPALLDVQMNGRVAGPTGNRHPAMAPHNNYRCAGDDEWISIAVGSQDEWLRLVQTMGAPEWTADPRFADSHERLRNVEALDARVTEWTRDQDARDLTERLQAAGVAAFPVLTVEGEYLDPHLSERECFVELEHPMVGLEMLPGTPWRFSASKADIRRHAPLLGQDNDYVLGELLRLSTEEIERLVAEEVVV